CFSDDWRCFIIGDNCVYKSGWCLPLARPPEIPRQPDVDPNPFMREDEREDRDERETRRGRKFDDDDADS
ncbi:hypothetical protein PMAYCL1PPCAC_21518, partial [Pristionchus mayeri]